MRKSYHTLAGCHVKTTTQFSSKSHGQYDARAAGSATSPLAPITIPRRDPSEDDVQIEIMFCGICHSDLHTGRNEWGWRCLSMRPRTLDCSSCDPGRVCSQQVQARRSCRGRLHGRF